jgi:hypothetical protein
VVAITNINSNENLPIAMRKIGGKRVTTLAETAPNTETIGW